VSQQYGARRHSQGQSLIKKNLHYSTEYKVASDVNVLLKTEMLKLHMYNCTRRTKNPTDVASLWCISI